MFHLPLPLETPISVQKFSLLEGKKITEREPNPILEDYKERSVFGSCEKKYNLSYVSLHMKKL